jgi:hypothetical protein
MSVELNYVVYTPSFNPNNGGTIFLHKLVHALNARGERAWLWPMPRLYSRGKRSQIKELFRKPPFKTSAELNTPVATKAQLTPNTVVVYPELVLGNPLKARHVARWLLYTPGKRHPYSFGDDEMFFRVDEFADLPEVTGGATDLFLWAVNRTYRNEQRPGRKGACFIVRKGDKLPRHPLTSDAIQIDGMSHAEINDVFNNCEVFYSYDDATMYTQYAAVCGCLSVVLPSGDTSRDGMLANHMLGRYGIAYGLDEASIAHARATQHKVIDLLIEREREGERSVDHFIEKTKSVVGERLETK